MKLSVIIVNYNVKFFLEQALLSVKKAIQNISAEIIVVDNKSIDGSVEMLQQKFPEVILIANEKNTGFSVANNQGIRIAKGEYILLLNPDTLVEEDTFEKCIEYMDAHEKAGAMGVKMIDGNGNFLPESKRGLPTPSTAFFKMIGLSSLFPKSKLFGRYHLGFLDENEIHTVDVLAGAFMLLRRKALDIAGLLDEDFFMYGEDIDLSYRIQKAGFDNIYFPKTRIIHYKGESTKKSSVNYVFVFYNAMIIFARKHFKHQHANTFSILIKIAIWFRALLSLIKRFADTYLLPILDIGILLSGMYLLTGYWEHKVKELNYPQEFYSIVIPIYVLIWITTIYWSGGFDKPIKPYKVIRGIAWGTIFILVVYALLPETMRFSRALILLGSVWASVLTLSLRYFLSLLFPKLVSFDRNMQKRTIIVGEKDVNRILDILHQSGQEFQYIGFFTPTIQDKIPYDHNYLGSMDRLADVAEIYHPNEIIFSAKDVSAQSIMDYMSLLRNSGIEIKIAPPESLYIIGSNDINSQGDIYLINMNSLFSKANRRNKRIFDFISSGFLLLSAPISIWMMNNKSGFIKNIFFVMSGSFTWIGYNNNQKVKLNKKYVLFPYDGIILNEAIDANTRQRINFLYTRNYNISNDLKLLYRNFRKLGRKAEN